MRRRRLPQHGLVDRLVDRLIDGYRYRVAMAAAHSRHTPHDANGEMMCPWPMTSVGTATKPTVHSDCSDRGHLQ